MKKNKKYYWDRFYKNKKSNYFWPWSDLISLINTYKKNNLKNCKVLEIGVGNGANIPFFLEKNCKFYGVDSSEYVVKYLKKRFPSLQKNFFSGNFEDIIIKNKKFDLIFDRGAISCGNKEVKIKEIIKLIKFHLKKNGIFIGVDWYSKSSTYYKNKLKISKTKNFFSYTKGPFKGIGNIYFSNKKDLLNNFKNFKILHLEEKKTTSYMKKNSPTFSSWHIVVKK